MDKDSMDKEKNKEERKEQYYVYLLEATKGSTYVGTRVRLKVALRLCSHSLCILIVKVSKFLNIKEYAICWYHCDNN